MIQIWPSLISSNLIDLKSTMELLTPHCSGWHLDIMDNHFVPNLTWGAPFVNAIARASNKPLWIHLMIDHPEHFLERLPHHPESYVTIHIETTSPVTNTLKAIKQRSFKTSIAVNPETPIEKVFPYLAQTDQILIMSVKPGWSGQKFIKEVITKVPLLKQELHRQKVATTIAFDGGINHDNILEIARLGVTQFGIASGIFDTHNPVQALAYLHEIVSRK